MELIKEYLKRLGIYGYVHELDEEWNLVVLAYAESGCEVQYHHCRRAEADKMLEHWNITGELKIKTYNMIAGEESETIEHPDIVHVLEIQNTYVRRDFPPDDMQP